MRFIYLVTCIVLFSTTNGISQEELAKVRTDKLYGYINPSGTFNIEPNYVHARDFYEGLAEVEEDDKFGFINSSGDWGFLNKKRITR